MTNFPIFRFCVSAVLLPILLVCTSCTEIPLVGLQPQSPKTELSIRIDPTGELGVYTVAGRTTLPDQTQLTVQAIRELKRPTIVESTTTNYSILARSQVTVEKGKWQTTLNLLQPSSNGKLIEPWQQNNTQFGLKFQPEKQVTFLVMTDPIKPSEEQPAQNQTAETDNVSVRFTADGRSYLQTEQALQLDPPVNQAKLTLLTSTIVKVAAKPAGQTPSIKSKTDVVPTEAWMR